MFALTITQLQQTMQVKSMYPKSYLKPLSANGTWCSFLHKMAKFSTYNNYKNHF